MNQKIFVLNLSICLFVVFVTTAKAEGPYDGVSLPLGDLQQQDAVCDCSSNKYNCDLESFDSKQSAQQCFDYCRSIGRVDVHDLDRDDDGLACESSNLPDVPISNSSVEPPVSNPPASEPPAESPTQPPAAEPPPAESPAQPQPTPEINDPSRLPEGGGILTNDGSPVPFLLGVSTLLLLVAYGVRVAWKNQSCPTAIGIFL